MLKHGVGHLCCYARSDYLFVSDWEVTQSALVFAQQLRQLGDVYGNALDVEKYPTHRHTKRKMNRSAQWAFFGPS
jgi:hypothetical protein